MGDEGLYVGMFKQVLSVSFDELGAEVKAATMAGCYIECASAPRDPVTIVFDKPFRYRIVDIAGIEIVQGFYNGN
jgi:serine protease inhibitor